jgi:hypothetical protein
MLELIIDFDDNISGDEYKKQFVCVNVPLYEFQMANITTDRYRHYN